jgi:hypothetical protein
MHYSSGMTLREAITRAALFYRKSSRMFLVAVLLASLVVIPNGSFIISGGGNGSPLAGQQQQLPSPNPTFQLIVALPLINDSMLGTNVTSSDPVLPAIDGMYNFIMIVAFIILGVSVIVEMITGAVGKRKQQGQEGYSVQFLFNIAAGVVIILIFPMLYDYIARTVNYLDMTIIAYPAPYTSYSSSISYVWNEIVFGGSIWDLITAGILAAARAIMMLILYVMTYLLGMVRLFIIGVMLAAFPVAVGLRMIPFTRKLSQMVEDTLFGLILASLMSAIVIGVAANVLESNSSSNIFNVVQGWQGWMAAAALFAAVLMPTVFAPLTSIVFQTASQAAMTGVGVGTAIVAGGAIAGVGGVGAAKMAVGGLTMPGSPGYLGSGVTPTTGQKLAAGMKAFSRHSFPAMLSNITSLGAAGTLGALGAGEGARIVNRTLPLKTAKDVTASYQAGVEKQLSTMAAQHRSELSTTIPQFVQSMKSMAIQTPDDQMSNEANLRWFDDVVRLGTATEKAKLASTLTSQEIHESLVPYLVKSGFFEQAKNELGKAGPQSFQQLRYKNDPFFKASMDLKGLKTKTT